MNAEIKRRQYAIAITYEAFNKCMIAGEEM